MADSSEDSPDILQQVNFPPEDYRTIVDLLQTTPQLYGFFQDIAIVVDLMSTKTEADRELVRGLTKIDKYFFFHSAPKYGLLLFTSASGFVEKSVSLARQILQDFGTFYITELPSTVHESTDDRIACLRYIRNIILNCTNVSAEFCLRLTRTGFIQDLVEDIKHIQHMSTDALEECEVFLFSLGTIQNCCIFPESAAVVRQLDIVPHFTPFLTKRGRSRFVQAAALAVIAHVVKDEDVDLLALDGVLLEYFLDNIRRALSAYRPGIAPWRMGEILFNLGLLARTDFNRRQMTAQGILLILHSVLDPSMRRSEEEKENTLTLISRLTEDPVNLQICQNYQELVDAVKGLRQHGNSQIVEKVHYVLGRLEHHNREEVEERIPAFPHVAQLLAGQYNLLSILHMGLAEFVLEEVTHVTGDQGQAAARGQEEASCHQGLLALTELTEDTVYRREITARGGLSLLKTVLQTGSREEKTEAAKAVLGLTRAPENIPVIRMNTDLTSLLEDVKQRADNPKLAQLADSILEALDNK